MCRLSQFFVLSIFLLSLVLSTAYAGVEPSIDPAGLSPGVEDSLKGSSEPTLQHILDSLGYNIDVVNDRLPTELWVTMAGQYSEVMLSEIAAYSGQTASGWYPKGSPADTHVVFRGPNNPPDSAHFYITGCDSNGLFIAPFAGGKCEYVYYTQPRLNPDHKDHAWVYCSKKRPNEFIVAWEDEYNLGDQDYNDLVLLYRMPNRPPVLSVPNDTSFYQCLPESICFEHIRAHDPDFCCDTVVITKIQGPGIFSAGKCRFLPAPVDSIYKFIFKAADCFGIADTDTVIITVNTNNPPQLTCPNTQTHHINGNYTISQVVADDSDGKISSLSASFIGGGVANLTLTNIQGLGTNHATAKVNYDVTDHCAAGGWVTVITMDDCGAADTCFFGINLFNTAPIITCPSNGSIRAGRTFISTNFSATDPDNDSLTVSFLSVAPPATNNPVIVGSHVEWITTCNEKGNYAIRLAATDPCGFKDTCEFTVNVYNQPPVLTCPNSDSVHAGNKFVSTNFSYTDPEGDKVTVTLCGITPVPASQPSLVTNHVEWQTACADAGKLFTICLLATDSCGAKDTCYFQVKVYNRPPVLTCPANDSVNAGDKFISTDYSVTDPDDPAGVTVTLSSISPTPAFAPTLVDKHVEWRTRCADLVNGPIFTITLIATDPCGAKDTCQFTVTVRNLPPVINCPKDDSVHVGNRFVSTDFSTSDPKGELVTVTLCGVTPAPTNQPTIVSHHVEWQTACADNGKIFTICLLATDSCGAKDTCYFQVKVYNRPPQLTCPNNGSVHAGNKFTSTNFSVTDPDGDTAPVTFFSITPPATHDPVIVGTHVEWVTTCNEAGKSYTIRLVATDNCGAKDTCDFQVQVTDQPPQLTCPDNGMVYAGQTFTSTNFSVTDPDGDTAPVTFLSINPHAVNNPTVVGNHVEWVTALSENEGDYTICLLATDPCGLKDTCCFTVTVVHEPTGVFECPEDDSVHAGVYFTSTNFSVTGPGANPDSVRIIGITPATTHLPIKVQYHVEWQTVCGDAGKVFTICLEATFNGGEKRGYKDTCCFYVKVYNRPPQLTCPKNDSVIAGQTFVSNNLSAFDIDGDTTIVSLLNISPPATHNPTIVGSHVQWVTTCSEKGDYVIRLVATDPCGLKDTCEFTVNVLNRPPQITCPDDGNVNAGQTFTSYNFSATDPDGNLSSIAILDINPTPHQNGPAIVGSHIEWNTSLLDEGDYVIRLVATDDCGNSDTCEFVVNVYNCHNPNFVISASPDTQYVTKGHSVDYLVKLTPFFGFSQPCTLLVSGLFYLSGSGDFERSVLVPTDSTLLHIHTSNSSPIGCHTLTVRAITIPGGGPDYFEHYTYVVVRVLESSDAGDWTDNSSVPKTFTLFQNQPNPFNPETQISYYLPKACQVKLTIYNILGQRVRTLYDGYQEAGMQTSTWDGKDSEGITLSSGIYFYRLQADDFVQTRKMSLLK